MAGKIASFPVDESNEAKGEEHCLKCAHHQNSKTMQEILIPAPVADAAAVEVANESVNPSAANLPKWSLKDFFAIHGKGERRRIVSNSKDKASFERYAFPSSPDSKDGVEVVVDFSKNLLKNHGTTITVKDKAGEDRSFQTVSFEKMKALKTSLMVYQTIHTDGTIGLSMGLNGEETIEEEDLF